MDAITLLKDDHKILRTLLGSLEKSTPRAAKGRTLLLMKIEGLLKAHSAIEEEIFYPAFKEAGQRSEDDKMYFEALEEHRAAGDLVLPDLLDTDPGSDQFSGRAKVLKELVEHHAGEEEKDMFPRAKKLLTKPELAALGERMYERKRQLLRSA
jgi:hemerythrin superfamily protein